MRRLGRHLISIYLSVDPRSLGLFRIVLGAVLLLDLYQRFLGVEYWYTDDGIVPTHLIKQANVPYFFSLFLYASTRAQAVLGMSLCALVYVLFTIGFKTRFFHLFALISVVSLNSRVFLLENGGNFVLNLLCVWSLFLPLGRRFSVDALLASWRTRAESTPEQLTDREAIRPSDRPVTSLAVLALLLQFGVIYLFNVIQKTGPAWREGTAVYYTLHDERMVRILAVWIREILPLSALEFLSWATLVVEAAAVVMILSPIATRHLRLAAIVLLPALHLGFGLCLQLGIFSYAMMSFFVLLLAREHWEWWERFRRSHLVGLSRDRLAERIEAIGRRLGLQVYRGAGDPSSASARTKSALGRGLSWGLVGLREVAVVVVMAACLGDLASSNPAWPAAWRYRQPEPLNALIWYPRIRQYWRMFTPEPPRSVVAIAVEAETEDGRIVDPYNEVGSRYPSIPQPGGARRMPIRLGKNQLFSDYTQRMPQKRFAWCRSAFRHWVFQYPARTGKSEDGIVRFRVYKVIARIPPPGSGSRARMTRKLLFSFP